jgi:hypothetical protein
MIKPYLQTISGIAGQGDAREESYYSVLADLHLLKSPEIVPPIAKCQGKGNGRVKKVKYFQNEGLVYFNPDQYFEGVFPEVWEYRIGGYQVCDKWLKDRKEKVLSLEDIKHYCKIITVLSKTIEFQKAIDAIYSDI